MFQRKFKGNILVRGEVHGAVRIRREANGSHAHLVLPGRQILHPVASLLVGQHADAYFRFRIDGLDKRSFKRRAVRPFHRARDRRGKRG